MRQPIPPDRAGYMLVDGEVHTRYAAHVERGPRFRRLDQLFDALAGAEYTVCTACYPPPPTRAPRKASARGGARRKSPPRRLPSIDEVSRYRGDRGGGS